MSELQTFLVRPALRSEAEAIFAVYRKAFDTLDGLVEPPSSANDASAETIRAAFGKVHIAVCEHAQKIVGCVFYRQEGEALYLYRLSVDPDWYNRGIAKRLIAHVEEAARRFGLPKVSLNVRLELGKNRQLFAGLGFAEVALRAHKGYDRPTYAYLEKAVVL